jgi:sentrin-specific protease 1
VDEALRGFPENAVLSTAFDLNITRKDVQTLRGLNWLNDEIINFYMSLIMDRSKNHEVKTYALNTFFYPKLCKDGYSSLKRWTRKVDLFSYDLLLVPIHLGMHWTLACVDFKCKEIRYYDSMNGNNNECLKALRFVFLLFQYF